MQTKESVCAVILGAGRSRRMGQPKLLLPWGERTVIGQIVDVLRGAGVAAITIVTGAEHDRIEAALADDQSSQPVRLVRNPDYEQTEMLVSLQVGIRSVGPECEAALVVLGDHPTITAAAVRAVVDVYIAERPKLVIPSYSMRRGHPWLVARALWDELLAMHSDRTPRDFLDAHSPDMRYVVMEAPEVLEDLDTPEDYRKLRKINSPSDRSTPHP